MDRVELAAFSGIAFVPAAATIPTITRALGVLASWTFAPFVDTPIEW